MAVPGLPESIVNTVPLMDVLNQTPLAMFPQEFQQLIHSVVAVTYVTVGGFFGIFVISAIIRWWQGHQLQKKFELILEKLDRIERKVSRKSK